MTKYKLEYIWLDGKHPVPGLRGKGVPDQCGNRAAIPHHHRAHCRVGRSVHPTSARIVW